jgi:methionyl-tRNA formyltransferase
VGDGVVDTVLLIGNVDPQTTAVRDVLLASGLPIAVDACALPSALDDFYATDYDLVVVAGWRHLVPPRFTRYTTTVGFHSARLPEYPGRAPVYWTLLRGDDFAWNTMLYLTEEPDAGDIIDEDFLPLTDNRTPDAIYEWVARSDAMMLRKHLPALLDGTAPRAPQDRGLRGPLTTRDGYDRWLASL